MLPLALAGQGAGLSDKSYFVVAADGSGDFRQVQAAIDAVPANRTTRTTIFIKPGTYREKIRVPVDRPHLSLRGESYATTILTFDDYAAKTPDYASTRILADDFSAENLTFQNTFDSRSGITGGQAAALRVEGDRALFYRCRITGFQDTYYAGGNKRSYHQECIIEGTTDFIYGDGIALFENCTINNRKDSHITAHNQTLVDGHPVNRFGFVFKNCTINVYPGEDVTNGSLGRPWGNGARVVYLHCTIGPQIRREGWSVWQGRNNHQTAFFAEYESRGPGAKPLERLPWTHQLTAAEAAVYTPANIFRADSTTAVQLVGDWNPSVPSVAAPSCDVLPAAKTRVILLTDIGGDLDDEQSLTRFLLYADQFDIEGLIATSIRIFPAQARRPIDGAPQPHYLVEWIKAYGEVRDKLLKHSTGWPEPAALLDLIKVGAKTGRDAAFDIRTGVAGADSGHYPLAQILGEGRDTEASQHIITVVDRDDPRPVWVTVWGGTSELAQALWRVRQDRTAEELRRFVAKLRVYAWGQQDATGPWMRENFPDLFSIVSTGGILYSADPALRDQTWLDVHVRFNHGALGALCPLRKNQLGEADSETFLGLISNGLNDLEHPAWGGWGGRFQRAPGSTNQWIDLAHNLAPETMGATIARWAPEFQNDYAARMDWCVNAFSAANHPPQPVLNGDRSLRPVEIMVRPGQRVSLDASGSTDPDSGDTLTYAWTFFAEAGTYSGHLDIAHAAEPCTSVVVPEDAAGTVLHVLLRAMDDGTPRLTSYRRLVLRCE